MKKDKTISTGSYSSKLTKTVSKIEEKAKPRKIRRIVFLALMLAVCAGGIVLGVLNRSSSIEKQYQRYSEEHDRSIINPELLSYKDVYEQFENDYLGNRSYQSLMGGFFCSAEGYSVYPNEDGQCSVLNINGVETTLSEYLASDVNIRNGTVFYRNPETREIFAYDISKGSRSKLSIENAGQFVVCGEDCFYIDLKKSSLICFNDQKDEKETLVDSGVSSFVIAGNDIIYLDAGHTLHSIDIDSRTDMVIGNNVNTFSYTGLLWLQNNDTLYQKKLDEKKIEEVDLGIRCCRLLGASDMFVFFEADDGVYIHNIETGENRIIDNEVFIGASSTAVLLYSTNSDSYKKVELK